MARPREVEGQVSDQSFHMRVSRALLEYVDEQRGELTRSRWIRDLIRMYATDRLIRDRVATIRKKENETDG